MSPLDSIQVQAVPHMVGAKTAVLVGNTLFVSPAMLALSQDATPDELRRLWAKIPILRIPEPSPYYGTF